MTKSVKKSFQSPDETRTFEKGSVDILDFGDGTIGLFKLEPGWQWSKHVKPIAQTDSCQAPHFQYLLSGKMAVRMEDGTEFEVNKGEVAFIAPGHDAWVVGNEPIVAIDWSGATNYAKK